MHLLPSRKAGRHPLIVVAALALLLATPLPAAGPSEITPETVVRLMNEYRAAAGVPPLRIDGRLAAAAGDRMRHMEEDAFWGHESPDGVGPFIWLPVRAYRFRSAAENLARGFETAELLVASWMESPGHRRNILSDQFADCGIAIIDGSTRGPATGRSVVVLFGTE